MEGDKPVTGLTQRELAERSNLSERTLRESISRTEIAGLLWVIRLSDRRPLIYYVPTCALLRLEFAAKYGNVRVAYSYHPLSERTTVPRRDTGIYSILPGDDESPVCFEGTTINDEPACGCFLDFHDNMDSELRAQFKDSEEPADYFAFPPRERKFDFNEDIFGSFDNWDSSEAPDQESAAPDDS